MNTFSFAAKDNVFIHPDLTFGEASAEESTSKDYTASHFQKTKPVPSDTEAWY
jgi:hypothetical protein